jgi:glycine oxidase
LNNNSENKANNFDVTIIGGGAIGVSIAYKLSKSKFRCVVVEKNTIGSGATQAAAGVISPLFYGDINLADNLNTPIYKLRKLSFDSFLTLGEELAEMGIRSPYQKTGILRVAFNEDELKILDNLSDSLSNLNISSKNIDKNEINNELSFLSNEIKGGKYFYDDGYVDGLDYVNKLKIAIHKMGCEIFENESFINIKEKNNDQVEILTSNRMIKSKYIIFCTGSWNILEDFDLPSDYKINPVKGQYILVSSNEIELPYTIGEVGDGSNYSGYLVPRENNIIYIGASKHPGENDNSVNLKGLNFCYQIARKYIKNADKLEFISVGTGIRPQSKIGTPIISNLYNYENILFISGHYTQGIMLSLGTGEIVKNYINKSDINLFKSFSKN